MEVRTLDLYDTLARGLMWGAVAVLGLAVIAAIAIAGSETAIPGLDEIQRQNRGVVAIGVFGTGLTGAGLLAGVGALLRLKVAEARRGQG